MAKVKLNLTTGSVVEKPVITNFVVNEKNYLILDAENIGSMGLPIILVCKIENDKVVKIIDANEWQEAKNYLKGIIAGNAMNYIKAPVEIVADEVYYTQLTLPVASFDVIKNAYKVEEAEEPIIPVEPISSVENAVEPTLASEPVIDIAMPEVPEVSNIPAVEPVAVDPVIPEIPVEQDIHVNEVSIEDNASGIDFASSKEAFMKACENMFDALVSKFQAELNSKK